MRIVQVNAIYGSKSTGTIVRDIQSCCLANGIECYAAYSIADRPEAEIPFGYHIGNRFTAKWSALLSRITGKQAYSNRISTWRFLRWLNKLNPDIVHLHNLHNNYIHLNMLLSYLAKHNIATVITMHDCWYFTGGCTHFTSVGCERWKKGCGHCPKWRKIPSFFFDRTHAVLSDRVKYLGAIRRLMMVGASEWIANEMSLSLLNHLEITFIHNGFDLEVFKPSPSEKRKQLCLEGKYIILGPASKWLLPINRPTLDYFILQMDSDAVLLLFGCSHNDMSLPKNVVQLGYFKDPHEMAQLYSLADVMVNCSREDTLSSLNLECQACGTPVVTFDATGSKETVDDKCGFSVKTGDYASLWNQVKIIRSTGKENLTEKCRATVLRGFDKKTNYDKYISLYNSLITK